MPGLVRDAAWSLISAVANAVGQWLALAAVARICGASGLGELAWAIAAVLPIHLVAGLQQRSAILAGAPGAPRVHLRLRLVTGLAMVAVAGMIGLLHGQAAAGVCMLVGLARTCEGVGEIALGFRSRLGRLDHVALAQVARAVLVAGGTALGAWLGGNATSAAVGMAGASAVTLLVELPLLHRALASGEPLTAWPLATRLAPLGVALGLAAVAGSLPRLILEAYAGAAVLGTFAAAASLAAAAAAAGQAWGPGCSLRLAAMHRAGDADGMLQLCRRVALGTALAALAGAAVMAFGGSWVMTLAFGSAFAPAGPVLAGLLAATAVDLAAAPAGYALTAAGVWRPQVPMLAASAVIAGVVAVVAIPGWGIYGAVIALVAAHGFRLAWSFRMVHALLDRTRAAANITP